MRNSLKQAIYLLVLVLLVVLGSPTVLPQSIGEGMVDFRMAPLEQAKKISSHAAFDEHDFEIGEAFESPFEDQADDVVLEALCHPAVVFEIVGGPAGAGDGVSAVASAEVYPYGQVVANGGFEEFPVFAIAER